MVFKALFAGANGNLNNPGDQFGFFDDTVLVVDGAFYSISTFEGNDLINCARPAAGGFHQIWCGSGNDTCVGGSGIDQVFDGTGNDVILLGDGADTALVGAGNDTYNGGNGVDSINFGSTNDDGFGPAGPAAPNITLDLAKTTAQNLGFYGVDTVLGFEDIFGGAGNETFSGNGLANRISGNTGNDFLDGRGGDDNLSGGAGSDTFIGGAGADFMDLTDAGSRDVIRYFALSDSGITATTRDTLAFFDAGGGALDDKIDLSAIDARPLVAGNQAFIFRGTGAFTSVAGEIRIVAQGFGLLVQIDTDTDAAPEMTIFMQNNTTLSAADFIL